MLLRVTEPRYARRKSFPSALAVLDGVVPSDGERASSKGLPDPPKVQIRPFSQPEGRAFLADFRPRGRRRSPDRLTSTRTKLHQELLRALRKDLRRAYLVGSYQGGGCYCVPY